MSADRLTRLRTGLVAGVAMVGVVVPATVLLLRDESASDPARLLEVPGRGLQSPWWSALPELDDDELVLPADPLFDQGSSVVRPDTVEELTEFGRRLVLHLDDEPGRWALVGGTDGVGDAPSNKALGFSRASARARDPRHRPRPRPIPVRPR